MIDLLDTNILIDLIKKNPPKWRIALMLCQKRVALEQQLERLAVQVPVLFPQAPEISQHYAEQATALKRAGTPIGANELWIACHALAEGATVVDQQP